MNRTAGLFGRVFLAVLATTLGAVAVVGLIARYALTSAFDSYLGTLPVPMGSGSGMGRRMLGAAEQTFLASVDRSVIIGALIACVVAGVAAYLIARHLTRPLHNLETAVVAFAAGERDSRATPGGPAEVVALSTAFNDLAESLSRAEMLRRRMVADIAHELRNPIAAARAQSEGMAEGVLGVDRRRLESVAEDMKHLSSLVDDLQELALAEAGELRYDMGEVDLAALVAEEVARGSALAGPGVAVRAETADGALLVPGDYRRLSEVLRNLLGNALRHTGQGSITVRAERVGDCAEVRVADTGEGIPDADLPYVFERFYRADGARATATGGAGLGLAISRQIVEDHGGEVFAGHTPGGGATVGFRIPLG